jgi:hypothetical protein
VTGALVFLAVTVAVAAVVCGHQGQPWPLAGLWEAVAARLAASGALRALRPLPESPAAPEGLLGAPGSDRAPTGGPSSATSSRQNAPQASSAPFPDPAPERASEARLCPRTGPSWARTQPIKEN